MPDTMRLLRCPITNSIDDYWLASLSIDRPLELGRLIQGLYRFPYTYEYYSRCILAYLLLLDFYFEGSSAGLGGGDCGAASIVLYWSFFLLDFSSTLCWGIVARYLTLSFSILAMFSLIKWTFILSVSKNSEGRMEPSLSKV